MATYGFSRDSLPKRTETMMPVLPEAERNIKIVCLGSQQFNAPDVVAQYKVKA